MAQSPSHTCWLGVQTRALHLAVALSQYCELVQVAERTELMPSSAHSRTVDPEQYSRLGEQASEAQAPWWQNMPVSAHCVPPAT